MEKTIRQSFLRIHPVDNVLVALHDLEAGMPECRFYMSL